MQGSAIRHPEHSYFIRRHDWQIKALASVKEQGKGKDATAECGAEILSIMEYHFNNKSANALLVELYERAMRKGSEGSLYELGDWMPYSTRYLKELLLYGRADRVIECGIAAIVARGFASLDVPWDIKCKYPTNATWIKLDVDAINQWIDENIRKSWIDGWTRQNKKNYIAGPGQPPPRSRGDLGMDMEPIENPIAAALDPAETITKTANTLFAFYVHVHGKTNAFLFGPKRKANVRARLKEGRPLWMCAAAILGNLFSDFHQGRHKDNLIENGGVIYDDLGLIFRDEVTFEKHVGYAEKAGITEAKAMEALEAFIKGEPVRYAKKAKQIDPTAYNEPQLAPKDPPNAAKYRELAMNVAPFFTSDTPVPEIIEFCKKLPNLVTVGNGLVDGAYMAFAIDRSIYTFREQGPTADMTKAIISFSNAFAQMQILNQEDE